MPYTDFFGSVDPSNVDAIQLVLPTSSDVAVSGQIASLGTIGPKRYDIAEVDVSDLSITQTNFTDVLVDGQSVTYQIIVRNVGPERVEGVIVKDVFPAALRDIRYTSEVSGDVQGNSPTGTSDVDDVVDMAADSSLTYTVDATVVGPVDEIVENIATITPPVGTFDPDVTNNQSTDRDVIGIVADLSVTQFDGISQAVVGQTVAYDILVRNAGPSDVIGATIVGSLSVGLEDVTYMSTATGTVTGNTSIGAGPINDVVQMAAGSLIRYEVTGRVGESASGVITSSMRVSGPAIDNVVETDPTNNLATDVNTIESLTVLGSQPTTILQDLFVESGTTDRFKLTAHSTGELRITAHFSSSEGNMQLVLDDRYGNPMSVGNDSNDGQQIVAPVVSQETYYIRVTGANGESGDRYDLEIENFPLNVPHVIGLDPSTDSGMFNDDALASRAAPRDLDPGRHFGYVGRRHDAGNSQRRWNARDGVDRGCGTCRRDNNHRLRNGSTVHRLCLAVGHIGRTVCIYTCGRKSALKWRIWRQRRSSGV